jgi:hypothetical protein
MAASNSSSTFLFWKPTQVDRIVPLDLLMCFTYINGRPVQSLQEIAREKSECWLTWGGGVNGACGHLKLCHCRLYHVLLVQRGRANASCYAVGGQIVCFEAVAPVGAAADITLQGVVVVVAQGGEGLQGSVQDAADPLSCGKEKIFA